MCQASGEVTIIHVYVLFSGFKTRWISATSVEDKRAECQGSYKPLLASKLRKCRSPPQSQSPVCPHDVTTKQEKCFIYQLPARKHKYFSLSG